jgi:ABC-type multidrug transport system ATPase subunit
VAYVLRFFPKIRTDIHVSWAEEFCKSKSFQVLLLDEITVDLDVVARIDLLSFFARECEEVKLKNALQITD